MAGNPSRCLPQAPARILTAITCSAALDGSFNITADYTCPVANTYPDTYILATGGDSGSGANSAITLVAPLGNCTDANFASSHVVVNEVSTVATMFAAQRITTDLTHVSGPSTRLAPTALSNINTNDLYVEGGASAVNQP